MAWDQEEEELYMKGFPIRELPFDCEVLDKTEVIKNPFSGESVELPPDAVAVYIPSKEQN